MLFITYIYDIVKIFNHANAILFANDMTLYVTGSSNDALFGSAKDDLEKLYNRCLSNRPTIKSNKTHYMLFSNRTDDILPKLKAKNNPIRRINKVIFLGVIFDESLT